MGVPAGCAQRCLLHPAAAGSLAWQAPPAQPPGLWEAIAGPAAGITTCLINDHDVYMATPLVQVTIISTNETKKGSGKSGAPKYGVCGTFIYYK